MRLGGGAAYAVNSALLLVFLKSAMGRIEVSGWQEPEMNRFTAATLAIDREARRPYQNARRIQSTANSEALYDCDFAVGASSTGI